jgi:hypothetical protein
MVATLHTTHFNNFLCISTLANGHFSWFLSHLNAKVITQQTQVTHAESLHHLLFELCYCFAVRPTNDKIIHIHPNQHQGITYTPSVYNMFLNASSETQIY